MRTRIVTHELPTAISLGLRCSPRKKRAPVSRGFSSARRGLEPPWLLTASTSKYRKSLNLSFSFGKRRSTCWTEPPSPELNHRIQRHRALAPVQNRAPLRAVLPRKRYAVLRIVGKVAAAARASLLSGRARRLETLTRNVRESIGVNAIGDVETAWQFQGLPSSQARPSRDRLGALPGARLQWTPSPGPRACAISH